MVRESRHSRRSLPGARAVARRRRRRRRGAIVLTLVFAVVVGGAALALAPDRADGNSSGVRLPAAPSNVPLRTFAAPHPPAPAPPRASAAAPAVAPALVRAAATPPGPPPWPNPAPPLPNPAPVPDPGHNVALMDVGRIDIPKIGLDQPVREGVEQMVIDAGPAHWRGTAAFGAWGNVVVAGHRATHTAPFRRAAELVSGDEILLADPSGTYRYRVTSTQVVADTAVWIVDQTPGRTLTIFTCHPIGSSAQRFVVHAELVSAPRPGH